MLCNHGLSTAVITMPFVERIKVSLIKIGLIKFIEKFGGQTAKSTLIKRINDFHRVVRIHASNAIKRIEKKLELEEELIT